jgi:WD40 repeat protein
MKGHTNVVTGLIFSKDEKKLYSASADRTIRIWELDNFTLIKTI